MRLQVHFTNVSRPKDVQKQIDCTFRDTLLNLSSVENLYKIKQQFNKHPKDMFSDWRRFYTSAFNNAVRNLSEKERRAVKVHIDFVH